MRSPMSTRRSRSTTSWMVRFGSSSRTRVFIAKKVTFSASRPKPYTGHGIVPTRMPRSPKPMHRALSAVGRARMQSHYSTTGKLLRFVARGLTGSYRTIRRKPKLDISSNFYAHDERLQAHHCVFRGCRAFPAEWPIPCAGTSPYQLRNHDVVGTPARLGGEGRGLIL